MLPLVASDPIFSQISLLIFNPTWCYLSIYLTLSFYLASQCHKHTHTHTHTHTHLPTLLFSLFFRKHCHDVYFPFPSFMFAQFHFHGLSLPVTAVIVPSLPVACAGPPSLPPTLPTPIPSPVDQPAPVTTIHQLLTRWWWWWWWWRRDQGGEGNG